MLVRDTVSAKYRGKRDNQIVLSIVITMKANRLMRTENQILDWTIIYFLFITMVHLDGFFLYVKSTRVSSEW